MDNSIEKKYRARLHNYSVIIMRITKSKKNLVFEPFCRCLLDNTDIFYSITESDNELSFIIDSDMEYYFSDIDDILRIESNYRVIQIYEGCPGVNHIGIVSEISSFFSDIGISILYINTFNNNFILVKEDDLDKSIEALEKIDFIIF